MVVSIVSILDSTWLFRCGFGDTPIFIPHMDAHPPDGPTSVDGLSGLLGRVETAAATQPATKTRGSCKAAEHFEMSSNCYDLSRLPIGECDECGFYTIHNRHQ